MYQKVMELDTISDSFLDLTTETPLKMRLAR